MSSRRQATGIGLGAAAAAILIGLLTAPAGPAEQPEDGRSAGAGVRAKLIGSFEDPVYVAAAPGKRSRRLLFVVGREGVVRVLRGRRTLARPFLDIRDRVLAGGERGLLSIAFDPGYASNRRFYAYFTDRQGDIRVQQFRRSRRSATRASRRGRNVIEVRHRLAGNHNGGQLAFGPDGKLWIGTGDGGGSCDPEGNAQDPSSLLGKLLRIAPRRRGGYRIPPANPFAGRAGRDEIYALGLRNPFRFSFDRRAKAIAIGDVGQSSREEIDYESLRGARGANFGWDAFEGTAKASASGCPASERPPKPGEHEPPIHEYRHSGPGHTGCAVTGGVVVRDRRLGALRGRYVYADFCAGQLRSLVPRRSGARMERSLRVEIGSPTSFGTGRGGAVYVTSLTGGLYRLVPR